MLCQQCGIRRSTPTGSCWACSGAGPPSTFSRDGIARVLLAGGGAVVLLSLLGTWPGFGSSPYRSLISQAFTTVAAAVTVATVAAVALGILVVTARGRSWPLVRRMKRVVGVMVGSAVVAGLLADMHSASYSERFGHGRAVPNGSGGGWALAGAMLAAFAYTVAVLPLPHWIRAGGRYVRTTGVSVHGALRWRAKPGAAAQPQIAAEPARQQWRALVGAAGVCTVLTLAAEGSSNALTGSGDLPVVGAILAVIVVTVCLIGSIRLSARTAYPHGPVPRELLGGGRSRRVLAAVVAAVFSTNGSSRG